MHLREITINGLTFLIEVRAGKARLIDVNRTDGGSLDGTVVSRETMEELYRFAASIAAEEFHTAIGRTR